MPTSPADTIIMIVDDAKTILKTGQLFLESAGYKVVLIEDGFSALTAIQDVKPDLMFLDVLMPRLDGYNTCNMIKANPEFAQVPVVMLSSKDGPFDKAKGQMMGCDDYLTKPFTKDTLLASVRKHTRSE